MAGAIITSPLDVVKTRLQSDMFKQPLPAPQLSLAGAGGPVPTSVPFVRPTGTRGLLWNFVETGHIVRFVISRTLNSANL